MFTPLRAKVNAARICLVRHRRNQNHSNQNNAPPRGGYGVRDYLVLARDFGRELARWAIPARFGMKIGKQDLVSISLVCVR